MTIHTTKIKKKEKNWNFLHKQDLGLKSLITSIIFKNIKTITGNSLKRKLLIGLNK